MTEENSTAMEQVSQEEKEKRFFDNMEGREVAMALQPRDYASAWKAAQVLAKSTMVPKAGFNDTESWWKSFQYQSNYRSM
jgi:hypothetical protein